MAETSHFGNSMRTFLTILLIFSRLGFLKSSVCCFVFLIVSTVAILRTLFDVMNNNRNPSMDEDVIDVEQLIDGVRQQPCIWNRSLPEHHTRAIIADAWRSVAGQINAQFGDMSGRQKEAYCKLLQKKWRNIRDQWAKSCKKVADQRRAGTPARHIKHYVYHEQLRFLQNSSEMDCDAHNSQHSDTSDLDAGNDNSKHLWSHRRTNSEVSKGQLKKQKLNNDLNLGSWNTSLTEHDPKLYFFKSVLPSIEDFSVDEMLEFQSGIIELIKRIKGNRYYQPPLENDRGTKLSSLRYTPMDHSSSWLTPEYLKDFATPSCDSPARSEQSVRSTSGGSENNESSTSRHSDIASSKDDSDVGSEDKDIPSPKTSNKVFRKPTADGIEKRVVGSALPESVPGHSGGIGRFLRGSNAGNAARKRKSSSKGNRSESLISVGK